MAFTKESLKVLKHIVTQKGVQGNAERERQLREEHRQISASVASQEHALSQAKTKLKSIADRLDAVIKENQVVKDTLVEINRLESETSIKDDAPVVMEEDKIRKFQNIEAIFNVCLHGSSGRYNIEYFIPQAADFLYNKYGINMGSERKDEVTLLLQEYLDVETVNKAGTVMVAWEPNKVKRIAIALRELKEDLKR